MRRFSELLDSLSLQPSRNEKINLIVNYLRNTPDPDRGYALAALTEALNLPAAKPAILRNLGAAQLDETLFGLSYDYVGDLAETVALIWQRKYQNDDSLSLTEVVEKLQSAPSIDVPKLLTHWLDQLETTGRWALLKLITGSLRIGVSARLAKMALALFGEVELNDIEELWHGRQPPYIEIFRWLSKQGSRPEPLNLAFRPFMLAHPLEEKDIHNWDATDFRAEWKWDGIRVQLVSNGQDRRIYSRGGDEISRAFPDILAVMNFDAVLDGELLIAAGNRDTAELASIAPFSDLQKRLNRKSVTQKMLETHPAHVRLYDLLADNTDDLRSLSFDDRRKRLSTWFEKHKHPRLDLSPIINFENWSTLKDLRENARTVAIEGLMLKRGNSPYVAGRTKGLWFKWKRSALTIDAVIMYAQRGHGKRSSFYSDYTFGCWRSSGDGDERLLVPVGKAYSGFTDVELKQLDKWIRENTIGRFGPVREVKPHVVIEIAFDAVQRSKRHKSGVALRFPRISRLRWDKPAHEADELTNLENLIK